MISHLAIYWLIVIKLSFNAEITECKSILYQKLSDSRKVGRATHLITDFSQRLSSPLDFFIKIFGHNYKTAHCETFA